MVIMLETKYKFSKQEKDNILELVYSKIEKDKSKIYLSSSIQYHELTKYIYEQLKDKLNVRLLPVHNHSCYDGQLLGCSDFKEEATYINITDGLFHSKIIKVNNLDSVVYSVNPYSNEIFEISKKEVNKIMIKKKASIFKFFDAKNIGIVISSKAGQRINDRELDKLKTFFKKQNKNYYLFVAENTNFSEFDNFNFIDLWINTACPRLSYDDAVEHNVLFPYYNDILELNDGEYYGE